MGSSELGRSEDDSSDEVLEPELVDETVDRLLPTILAKIESHLHLPIQLPDADALARLKREDPAAHKMWLKQVGREMEHQRFMREAKYRMPLRVIISSQVVTLIALLAILGLAGYSLYLDRPWLATFLASIDLVAVLMIFAGIGRGGEEQE